MEQAGSLGCPFLGSTHPSQIAQDCILNQEVREPGAGKMAQELKYLLCKCEDPSLTPSTRVKQARHGCKVAVLVILALQGKGRWIHGPHWASQPSLASKPQVPGKDPV